MNSIVLVGRLTRDPELRYTTQGHAVASFTLAVDRPFSGQNGEREADFVDVVAWRKLAEVATEHLQKGSLVGIQGRLQIRSYQAQDGQKRKATEVIASEIRFIGSKPKPKQEPGAEQPAAASADTAAPAEEEDVPF